MNKPLRESWFRYYIAEPLSSAWCWIKETTTAIKIKLIGGWYCEYCHKIHGRRVYRYMLIFVRDPDNKQSVIVKVTDTRCPTVDYKEHYACSLGKKAIIEEGWAPEYASLYGSILATRSAISGATRNPAKALGKGESNQ